MSEAEFDKTEAKLAPPSIDWAALRAYRLERVRSALRAANVDYALLTNPLSLQYTIDQAEYQLFQSRIPSMVLMVPAEGSVTLYGAYLRNYEQVDEYLPSPSLTQFDAGLDVSDRSREFADHLRDKLVGRTGGRLRVAVDRFEASSVQALMQVGFDVVDAGGLLEGARSIKSPEEITMIRYAIDVAQFGMDRMREASLPGITETELLSILHQTNIAHGGRWMDGRMLSSGPRTNPWLQEASDRVIEAGDMIAFDTDMIGPFGYFADISRSWLCGDGNPSDAQKDIYRRAYEEVMHNMALARPGVSFQAFSEKAFKQDEEFVARRYPCVTHGAGMSDEWPKVVYQPDWPRGGYDGHFEAGMVLCIESFVGSDRGGEGVKLEQMVLLTEAETVPLSTYPFEEVLLT